MQAEAIALRPGNFDDSAAILALNHTVVAVTSPMDDARFATLLALGMWCTVAERDGAVIGFILAMQQGAAYDNANFAWFAERLDRFVYIDRIVIGEAARGLGLGRALYDDLACTANRAGQLLLAAEIDIVPANPGSIAFHRAYGFAEIGQRTLSSGKIVSMQVKRI